MERIYCILIGYFCGGILMADFISKRYTGHYMPENGPDNPGTASIVIKHGIKAGLMVLLGDLLKTFIAIIVCNFLFFKELGSLAISYAGLGAVLGHCFPVFRHFHGGKGVAVTGAYSLSLFPPVGLISYAFGGLAAFFSGYLALGSAAIAISFPITTFLFGLRTEEVVLSAAAGAVILICHRKSFRLICSGKEKNFNFLKRIKK